MDLFIEFRPVIVLAVVRMESWDGLTSGIAYGLSSS
jgi:hypothetical protein